MSAPIRDDCRQVRLSLGTYVLGVVDPPERAAVTAHLQACPGCREELAELAGLPGLLGMLDEPQVAALAGPAEPAGQPVHRLLEAAAARLGQQNRQRRRRIAAAAGGGFLTAGAASAAIVLGGQAAGSATTQVTTATAKSVTARVEATPRQWGTQLRLQLTGVAKGQRCRLVVVDRSGATDVAASWRAEYDGADGVTGSTGLPVNRVAAFRVVTPDGRVLLTLPGPS